MRHKIEKERKLTSKEIQEAIEEKICPYCKDETRGFWGSCQAFQELWFDEKGKIDYGDSENLDSFDFIECRECGRKIPKEIWEKWF